VEAAKLISNPSPVYPSLAREKQIQGDVLLHAIIGMDGGVKHLSVISGDPSLTQASLDAVRQWRYQPTLLNGDPVEVDTTIKVTFSLDQKSPQQQAPAAAGSPGPAPASAPTSAAAPEVSPPIDPKLNADILHLFDVIKVRDMVAEGMHATLDKMRPSLVSSLPPTPNRDKIIDTYIREILVVTQSDYFLNSTAAVYAKYLSDADVKAMTAFYQTPAGQHYNAASSKIFAESGQVAQQIVAKDMPGILKDLCSEYPELQGQAKFCPKVEPAPGNPALPSAPTPTPPSAPGAAPPSGGKR
jgi:TonB family protein